jgi:hypothetical protein
MFRTKLLSFIYQAGQERRPRRVLCTQAAEDAAMRRVDDAQVI